MWGLKGLFLSLNCSCYGAVSYQLNPNTQIKEKLKFCDGHRPWHFFTSAALILPIRGCWIKQLNGGKKLQLPDLDLIPVESCTCSVTIRSGWLTERRWSCSLETDGKMLTTSLQHVAPEKEIKWADKNPWLLRVQRPGEWILISHIQARCSEALVGFYGVWFICVVGSVDQDVTVRPCSYCI